MRMYSVVPSTDREIAPRVRHDPPSEADKGITVLYVGGTDTTIHFPGGPGQLRDWAAEITAQLDALEAVPDEAQLALVEG